MQISTTVNIGSNESFPHSSEEAATLVLNALSGNPLTDFCSVFIQQSQQGAAGLDPALAEAPPAE